MHESSSQGDREQGIRMWWGYMDQSGTNGGDMIGPVGDRIFAAFRQILPAMSAEHFQDFLTADPVLVWLPRVDGAAFGLRLAMPVAPGALEEALPADPPAPVVAEVHDSAGDALSDALSRLTQKGPALVTRKRYVIYLAPTLYRWSDRRLVSVIAEEVALSSSTGILGWGVGSRMEGEAIALATQWGFRPSGARARLRKMQEQEKQLFGAAPD